VQNLVRKRKKADFLMLYGASALPKLYQRSPAWHFAAAFIVVGILHGLALHAMWMPAEPVSEPSLPLRMVARTLQIPAPARPPAAPLERAATPPPAPIAPVEIAPAEIKAAPVKAAPVKAAPVKIAPAPRVTPLVPPKPVSKPEKPVVKPAVKPVVPPKAIPTKMPTRVESRDQKPPVSVTPSADPATAPLPREVKKAEPPVVEVAAQYGAAYLQNPAPDYPILSRRRREQGTVQLQVWVTTGGRAEKVEVVKSSGFERLDAAALATVKQWRFIPARRGEVAVASSVFVPIVFALN
jgi:protein TonB